MPRQTFLDTILNRPSQSYAPATPEKKSKNQSKWSTPSDLPNAPRNKDSILAGSMFQSGSNSLGKASGRGSSMSGAMSAGVGGGGGGSTFGRSSFSSMRFGKKKKDRRDSISESDAPMSDFGGGTSIADSSATVSKKRYSRWWNPSGNKNKNYAGSVADSIFSEPANQQERQMPGGWNTGGNNNLDSMVGIGAGNSSKRGTRSDYGGESPSYRNNSNNNRASIVPPLPNNAPATLKAWSSNSTLTSGIGGTSTQLAQSPPSNGKRSSKSKRLSSYTAQAAQIQPSPTFNQLGSPDQRKKLSSNSSPNLKQQEFNGQLGRSTSTSHRKSAHGGSQEWRNFVEGMKGSETAKAWEGGSHGQGAGVVSVANSSDNLARRKSVVERLQRELEQDAQFDQNQSGSGVRNGDILGQAAAHVVGDTQSYPLATDGSGEYENNRRPSSDQKRSSHIPPGFQPGSIIPPPSQANSSSPKKSESRRMPGAMGQEEESSSEEEEEENSQDQSASTSNQDQEANTSREGETSGSEESSSEEEEEESRLDVLPEEDEDSSSAGGHEMKPRLPIGPHVTGPGRAQSPQGRLSAFEAALKRNAPVEASRTEISATSSTPAVVVNGQDEEDSSSSEEELSPPVPPKNLPPTTTSIPVYPTASPSSPPPPSKRVSLAPESQTSSIPADGGSLGLHSNPTSPTTEVPPDAQSSRGVKFDAASITSARRPSSTLMIRRASDNASKKSEGSDEVMDDGASSKAPSTRPATLRRRLSDLSLGGSFAFSQIMRNADGSRSINTGGRSSSRKIKMRDDDEDSNGGSGSEEGDEDLRERARKEQDRLRNIKVGEDFFGPSLSGILDSFATKDWDAKTLDRVGGLDLAGTSTSKKRESGQLLISSPSEVSEGSKVKSGRFETPTTRNLTADEELAVSAQERMTEIRRQRAESADPAADAESQATGIAPSFAALWLLQNASSKDEPSSQDQTPASSSSVTNSPKSISTNTPSLASPKGRFSSLFSSSNNTGNSRVSLDSNANDNSTVSVLNRPRNRAAKPTEMGGVPISQGKLVPESPIIPEDNRSTLPRPVSSVKVGDNQTSPASTSSAFVSTPNSPGSPSLGKSSADSATSSEDKPAPTKSALKNKKSSGGLKHSKSLADTLFSLPLLGSSAEKEQKKEEKKEKARRASVSKEKAPPSSWASKEGKVAKLEKKASQKQLKAAAAAAPSAPPATDYSIQASSTKNPQPINTSTSATTKFSSPSSSSDSGSSSFASPNSIPSISTSSPISKPIKETEILNSKKEGQALGQVKASQVEEEISGDDSFEKDVFHPSLSSIDTANLALLSPTTSNAINSGSSPSSPLADQFSTPLASPAIEQNENQRDRTESDELDLSLTYGEGGMRREYITAKDLVGMANDQNKASTVDRQQSTEVAVANGIEMSSLDGAFSLPEFSVPKFEPKAAEPQVEEEEEEAEDDSDEEQDEEQEPEQKPAQIPIEPSASANSKSPAASPSGPPSEMWSEPSGTSTSVTTPGTSEVLFGASISPTMKAREWAARNPPVIAKESEKRLPMPPPPTFSDSINDDTVKTPTGQDRTPMAINTAEPSFGVNLIPPTPPALETRQSFTASRGPADSVSAPLTEDALEGPIGKQSHSSSSSGLKRSTSSSSKTSKTTLTRTKSSSSTSRRKSTQPIVEYDGKGMLSLPAGLVATTVASSSSRRKSADEAAIKAAQPSTGSSASDGGHAPVKRKSKKSSKEPRSPEKVATSRSYSSFDTTGAPGVPAIPSDLSSASPSISGSYPTSSAGSDGGGSVSPAPSSSGRASVSMASDASSRDLSPGGVRYPKKIRTLSAGPTARPQLRMSAINEWESSAAHSAASPSHVSPANSSPASPYLEGSPGESYPALPPSTISRTSSAGSGRTPSVVRNAPMGASTNSYLHPPIPRSRRSLDMAAQESEEEATAFRAPNRAAVSLDGHSAPREWHSAASSNASAHSLASQSAASLPAVPLSSYRPHKDPVGAAGTIDERLYARTTMSTVTISSGAFATKSKSLRKRSSVHENVNGSGTASNRGSLDIPEHLQDELSQTTISLTAHTPPPRKISSTQVLVQIIAVAIDEMDRLLLREKIRTETAYGFVPGRSFCGRVMEAGWDVKRMRKGDIIFGLQDSRKCGALAEFMTIDQELIAKAPEDCLTTEQIAALPFTGVMAYQIMQNHCSMLPRGARVLVLNAHDGIGLLTMQECASLSLIIVAQCPASVSDAVAVCEANGAHEVIIGEPLWALNSLHESSFDLVIDTIGGRRVYDAARRILAHDGQFATCFGDEHSMANPTLRSHLRSLRRSFFKKDKKNIGYEWIGADTGEDCRQALEAVKMAAEKGDICPRLSSILPFADAPRAFDPVIRKVEEEPGAVVVRVS